MTILWTGKAYIPKGDHSLYTKITDEGTVYTKGFHTAAPPTFSRQGNRSTSKDEQNAILCGYAGHIGQLCRTYGIANHRRSCQQGAMQRLKQ